MTDPGGAATSAPSVARPAAYALIVYAITVLVATGTVPVALYQTYADEFRFSPAVLTILAASSAVGVIVAVLVFGRLSDMIGRRPVLLPALAIGAASLLVFLAADGVAALLTARILSGLALGAFVGAGTAALTELAADGDTRRAATHAATASVAGFALGPVIGGVFVEYGPWPLRLVYAVGLVLLVPAVAGVALMPETMTKRRPFVLRPQRLSIPAAGRRSFGLASLIALCAFATASFFQSLGPTFVIQLLSVANRATAGAVVFCFLGASALAQMRFRGLSIRRATLTGLVVLPAGIALLVASLLAKSLALFVAGALIGGLGQGLGYLGGQSLVERAAPAHQRGEVFSTYLVVIYIGGGGSAISLGFAAKEIGLHPAAVAYGLIVGAVTVATAVIAARSSLVHADAEVEGSLGPPV